MTNEPSVTESPSDRVRRIANTCLDARLGAREGLDPSQEWFLLISLVNGLAYALIQRCPDEAEAIHAEALRYAVRQERATRTDAMTGGDR